jgi:formate/nitrite transporter
MVFSFVFGAIAQTDSGQRLLFGFGFSLGLMFIVTTNCFLWTGDVGSIGCAWLTKRVTLGAMLKTWLIVYAFNVVGSVGGAFLCGYSTGVTARGTAYGERVIQIAVTKAETQPLYMVMRAICGNWMICMANFLALMNKSFSGKILGIALGIMTFGAIGYDHAMANWNMLTMGKLLHPEMISWEGFAMCVVLTTFGNMVGGFCFVSCPAALTIYLERTHYKYGIPRPAHPDDENDIELDDIDQEVQSRATSVHSRRRTSVVAELSDHGRPGQHSWENQHEGDVEAPPRRPGASSDSSSGSLSSGSRYVDA